MMERSSLRLVILCCVGMLASAVWRVSTAAGSIAVLAKTVHSRNEVGQDGALGAVI
jgi:hypothetical protein